MSQPKVKAIYGMGDFYERLMKPTYIGNSGRKAINIDLLKGSGFTMAVPAILGVNEDGSFNLDDDKNAISGGIYKGLPNWPEHLKKLKEDGSSVNSIQIGLGGDIRSELLT